VNLASRRKPVDKEEQAVWELTGCVRGFLSNKSMKSLAETDLDFEWWFQLLAKKVAEIDAWRDGQNETGEPQTIAGKAAAKK
jgi:hypothetical protein